MKHPVTMFLLALSMVTVMVACQTNKGDKKAAVDEIREVLAQHDKALSEKNLDNLMATFSTDPKTVERRGPRAVVASA